MTMPGPDRDGERRANRADGALNRTPLPVTMGEAHVVIVGAGFGGLSCARALGRAGVRTTLIDRRNHHLFVPLLYQVATAALSPADIAEPVRSVLRRYKSVDMVLGEVTGVDTAARRLEMRDGGHVPYDRLVLATGSTYNYFGHPEWAALAPGPKTIEDARAIRTRVLLGFERAESSGGPDERAALMTMVLVGGGPTGVEMAGALAELTRHSLAMDFRRIDPTMARVVLIEAGPRLLASFPEKLGRYAQAGLEKLGVEVMLNTRVEDVRADGVVVHGQLLPAHVVVWGAGIAASPAARWLGVEEDRAGRLKVGPDLGVPGHAGVYAIGDTGVADGADGKPLPALAQVAKQQGEHLGAELAQALKHGRPVRPFVFRNRGNTAIVGRSAAVFDFGRWQLTGRPAWLLWAIVHVYLLIGFDKRLLVSMQWAWRYLTYKRGARLIAEATLDMPGRRREALAEQAAV